MVIYRMFNDEDPQVTDGPMFPLNQRLTRGQVKEIELLETMMLNATEDIEPVTDHDGFIVDLFHTSKS